MKTPKHLLPLSTAALAIVLLSGTVYLMVDAASEVSKTSVFEHDLNAIVAPADYESSMARGDRYADNEEWSLAIQEYANAAQLQDDNPRAYMKLGWSFIELNEIDKALAQFERAHEIAPNNAEVQLALGITLTKQAQYQRAYETLNPLADSNQSATVYAAISQMMLSNHDSAEKFLERAMNQSGDIPVAHVQGLLNAYADYHAQQGGQVIYLESLLAKALIQLEEFQVAEALARRVIQEKPDYRDAWILMGYSQLKSGDYESAEDSFAQAKSLDSIKPETHYFLATAHYHQEEYEEAISEYELALLYGFDETEIYKKMAEAYLFLERYEEALEAYEFIIKVDPSNVELFVRPVWISIDILNDLSRAQSLAQASVDSFPGDAMSHNLLGWVYLEQNKTELAESELSTALAIDSELAEAHYNLGLLHLSKENIPAAQSAFKTAYDNSTAQQSIHAKAAEQYNMLLLNPDSQ